MGAHQIMPTAATRPKKAPLVQGKRFVMPTANPGIYVGPLPDSPWSGLQCLRLDNSAGESNRARAAAACVTPPVEGVHKLHQLWGSQGIHTVLSKQQASSQWQVGGPGEEEEPAESQRGSGGGTGHPARSAKAPTEVAL